MILRTRPVASTVALSAFVLLLLFALPLPNTWRTGLWLVSVWLGAEWVGYARASSGRLWPSARAGGVTALATGCLFIARLGLFGGAGWISRSDRLDIALLLLTCAATLGLWFGLVGGLQARQGRRFLWAAPTRAVGPPEA